MATITEVRNDLYPIIANTLSDINRQFDVGEVNRLNWRKMVEDFEQNPANGFNPPYVVIQWGNNYEIEGGAANSTFETWARIYYMTSTGEKEAEDVLSEIETALLSLRTALRDTIYNNFMVLDTNIDITDSLACNVYFMQYNVSMYGGSLVIKLVYGECPG